MFTMRSQTTISCILLIAFSSLFFCFMPSYPPAAEAARGPCNEAFNLRTGYAPGLYGEMYDDLWGKGSYSRVLDGGKLQDLLIDKGLSWGSSFVNSMGEETLSGTVDGGRARMNFNLDKEGYFSGESDVLLPFYDSVRTTAYTQFGTRSMHDSSDTRWAGNFGLGQRWFPLATGKNFSAADYDAGNLMLGYNAFLDYDHTRDHRRAGAGAEIWHDWLLQSIAV